MGLTLQKIEVGDDNDVPADDQLGTKPADWQGQLNNIDRGEGGGTLQEHRLSGVESRLAALEFEIDKKISSRRLAEAALEMVRSETSGQIDKIDVKVDELWERLDRVSALNRELAPNAKIIQNLEIRLSALEMALKAQRQPPDLFLRLDRRICEAQARGKAERTRQLEFILTPPELQAALSGLGFIIELSNATAILSHLQSRRLLVLEGAPGTGKTTLAKLLARIFFGASNEDPYVIATLDPEWSIEDMIGGLRMLHGHFGPHLGHLTAAVIESIFREGEYWLILDEINRGDISSLLAPVLDGLQLEVGNVFHPFLFPAKTDQGGNLPVPSKFRIIGTMNSFDADQLFYFSDALRARTGFVRLEPPDTASERSLIEQRIVKPLRLGKSARALEQALDLAFEVVGRLRGLAEHEPRRWFRSCAIGTRDLLDLCRYILVNIGDVSSSLAHPESRQIVDVALASVIFDGLRIEAADVVEAINRTVLVPTKMFPNSLASIHRQLERVKIF